MLESQFPLPTPALTYSTLTYNFALEYSMTIEMQDMYGPRRILQAGTQRA
jgi:hypothetical protein